MQLLRLLRLLRLLATGSLMHNSACRWKKKLLPSYDDSNSLMNRSNDLVESGGTSVALEVATHFQSLSINPDWVFVECVSDVWLDLPSSLSVGFLAHGQPHFQPQVLDFIYNLRLQSGGRQIIPSSNNSFFEAPKKVRALLARFPYVWPSDIDIFSEPSPTVSRCCW